MSDAPIMSGMNHVTDLDSASDFERKHTPYIEVTEAEDGKARVRVVVGHYHPHPNQPDHYIQWIGLYAGEAEIGRFDFVPVASAPDVSMVVDVDPGTTIRAIEHCNLHGLWDAEAAV